MSAAIADLKAALAASPRGLRVCEECCGYYQAWRIDQRFCSGPCNKAYFQRMAKRGAVLLPVALKWRKARGEGPVKLGDVTHILDGWLSDDLGKERKYKRAVADLRAARPQKSASPEAGAV